jgi:4-amino-4-deoxy-L-arabinose transferase-like glycosyltransferase
LSFETKFGKSPTSHNHSITQSHNWVALLLLIYCGQLLLHGPLLHLPYFWDEAGYYVPAAYDIYKDAALIPHSTISNAHPPLVMAYLALAWKIFGFSPIVTRCFMLLVSAFGLLGVYRLAEQVSNRKIALASLICVALYPVWFAQSSLAQVDLAAAALTIWGLWAWLRKRPLATAIFFALAVLAKETAIVTPLAILGWEMARRSFPQRLKPGAETTISARLRPHLSEPNNLGIGDWKLQTALLIPLLPLALWFLYHHHRTGYFFGNPEFFRYNVEATLAPGRILFAAIRRLWQLLGYMNLYALTIAMVGAMFLPALRDRAGNQEIERERIAIPTQLLFLVIILAHWVVFSFIGGAVLARYLLPAIPLVIIIAVSTLHRRARYWLVVVALVCVMFVAALYINPPYTFAPEDNLAYSDYVTLHQHADSYIESKYPHSRVLTAWTALDELSKPFLGYVTKPIAVTAIEDFSLPQIQRAQQAPETYDVALLFSTKYIPRKQMWMPAFWRRAQEKYFGLHADLPPDAAAQMLGGTVAFKDERGGQWVAVLVFDRARNASLFTTETQRSASIKSNFPL